MDVWIGTTTGGGESKGIYHLTLDEATGELSDARLVGNIKQPGFLALHPTLPILYSTGGVGVAKWRMEGSDLGIFSPINDQRAVAQEGSPAHLAVDRSGRVLLTAHYGSGSVCAIPLDSSGSFGDTTQVIKHPAGSGVVPDRQKGPHPHWIGTSPDNRFVFVPDLGCDKVFIYELDAERAELTAHGSVDTPPGGGPRHMKFSPDGRHAYVVNELTMSLTVMTYDAEAGAFEVIQTIPTISEQQKAGQSFNSGSEVRVHPSGRFVYSANRGHDSITAFAVDAATGQLSLVEQEPIRGAWPRNFSLSPSGKWLLAAGRDSNTLAVFAIDQSTGELRYDRQIASVPSPICVTVGRTAGD
ncbi:MAG: lactonase family protein [Planctomycetota bacterium]